MEATVVIPARNAEATLPAALAALARQEGGVAWEVVVVDDGSTDETAALARAAGARVVTSSAKGPSAARNLGAAHARGSALAFTDADCAPTPGWLAAGLAALRSADLVQGRVTPPPGVRVGPYDRHITVLSEYGLYETANLFVRRELFERLGGFESILVPSAGKELGEDVWLGWRARRAGARTAFADDALVHHAVFPRGPGGYVAERWRVRFFPELVRRIPELRDSFCYRRLFLSARSARFDLALLGLGAAAATRRAAPLLLAAPYARTAARRRERHVMLADVAADCVSAAALLLGSVRSRSLLA
jgi:glycosyltransferase involved in cell wall biosynthesis